MSRRRPNRNNNSTRATPVRGNTNSIVHVDEASFTEITPATTSEQNEEDMTDQSTSTTPPVISDNLTNPGTVQTPESANPKNDSTVGNILVTEEQSSLSVLPEDSQHVVRLKSILSELKQKLLVRGKRPPEYKDAARLSYAASKMIQTSPRTDVLETFLAFFDENRTGVANPTEFMKGSVTLSANEEQLVGFVHGLFYEISSGRFGRIDPGVIMNTLGNAEVVEFYNRKKRAARRE